MISDKKLTVVQAAQSIFLRYGFKRVTMADIAEAVGISRPSLYLIFPNKEEIFRAIITHMTDESLAEIHRGVKKLTKPLEQLRYAFEIWTVRPYELVRTATDMRELITFAHEFCTQVYFERGKIFEKEIASIIAPYLKPEFSDKKMARMLRGSIRGFKEIVLDVKDLRNMIDDFLDFIIQTSFKKNSK